MTEKSPEDSDFVRGRCRYCNCRRVVGVEIRCGCVGSRKAADARGN